MQNAECRIRTRGDRGQGTGDGGYEETGVARGRDLQKLKRGAGVAFTLLLCCDMFFNADVLISALYEDAGYRPYASWSEAYELTEPAIDEILSMGSGFYRIEKDYQRTYNDSIAFGYNSISHYSSAYKKGTIDLLRNLGMWQNWFRSSGRGSTIVTDALFSVKYRLSRADIMPGYDKLFTMNGISVFENPYAFPVAVMSQLHPLDYSNPFLLQNSFVRGIHPSVGDVFYPAPFTVTTQMNGDQPVRAVYRISAVADGPLYLYMDTARAFFNASVYVEGRLIGSTYEEYSVNNMFSLGDYPPGAVIEVTLDLHDKSIKTDGHLAYQLDAAKMGDTAVIAQLNGLEVDRVYANGLTGTINAPDGGWLYTSIPYDEGWRLTVDGRRIETASYAGALLCAYMPAGAHSITLRFTPPGLILEIGRAHV